MPNQNDIKLKSMLRKGTMLHGTYRVDGYLSSGGFGNTYVATHVNFGKQYAIKEFFMDGVNERDNNSSTVKVSNESKVDEFTGQRSKFYKEAQRLHNLDNRHIVRVYDLFDENGTTYYVMDYIDGENLRDRLVRTGRPMSEQEVEDVLRQVLDALDEVHRQGLWHMDLKPANIMMDRKGIVKLIDFGASKQFNSDKGGALSTSAVTYTNGYAPREQMERNYQKFGPWTDFYALGATLYNLLTNRKPPMPSDIDDDRTPDKQYILPKPAGVSDYMWDLVLWLMKTHRSDRPQSVSDITNYLDDDGSGVVGGIDDFIIREQEETHLLNTSDHVADSMALNVEKSAEPKPVPAPKPKRNLKAIIIAACVALALVTGGYAIFSHNKPESNASDAPTEWAVEQVEDAPTDGNQGEEIVVQLTLPTGPCTYTGTVMVTENGDMLPDGKGVAVYDNGDKCEGTFVAGNISGDDIHFTYANGDTFVGSYKDNKPYQGRYTLSQDGSYSEGLFKDINDGKTPWYDKNGNKL